MDRAVPGGFRHLVVLDGTRCVGVIDDRRIVQERPLGLLRASELTVGEVIRKHVTCVLSDTPAPRIARIMLDEQMDAVPVVSQHGEIVGLVTTSDLLTLMAADDPTANVPAERSTPLRPGTLVPGERDLQPY